MEIKDYVLQLCEQTKNAASILSVTSGNERNTALLSLAGALVNEKEYILKENEKDLSLAEQNGVPKTMLDRLKLTEARIDAMAEAIADVAKLPDPLGNGTVTVRPNGLKITKIHVPIGVTGIIYEARPNVTADAAALCIKSGNGVVLKGGKEAINTNRAIVAVIKKALAGSAVPPDAVALIDSTERAATTELMHARGFIDVLIPRGGKGLIRSVTENASVPVIETGAGNCHIYIDRDADLDKAVKVAVNAKASRPSVCNAVETMLVHESIAKKFLPKFAKAAESFKVEIRGCEKTLAILPEAKTATEEDYETEYNDFILAVKVVSSLDEAIEHIKRYTTGHSEAIITESLASAKAFTERIDAAAVYVNASTRFTDGGEFGLGAEIGISTQKLHARGPMGLSELTTVKYIVEGDGQIR